MPFDMFFKLLGLALLLAPFLPIEGRTSLPSVGLDYWEWLLGIMIVGGVGYLIGVIFPDKLATDLKKLVGRFLDKYRSLYAETAAVVTTVLSLAVSKFAHSHSPQMIDEIAQLFQAKIFASGAITVPTPKPLGFFMIQQMLDHNGRWSSQYPPGNSLLLALGELFNAPFLIPALLTGGAVWLICRTTERMYCRQTAVITSFLCMLCPFLLFMGGTYMNHVPAIFFAALAIYGMTSTKKVFYGIAIGGMLCTRPLEGFIIALATVSQITKRRDVVVGALTTLPFLGAYLLYNYLSTGDPLLTGYHYLWGNEHAPGFHKTPWGEPHTLLAGLKYTLFDLNLLNEYLFETPIPGLIPIGIYLCFAKELTKPDKFLTGSFLLVALAYTSYWHRDYLFGPRFLYCTIPFLIPLTARALISGAAATSGRLRRFIIATTCSAFILAVCYLIPNRFYVYTNHLPSFKEDLAEKAELAGIKEGIVFVPVSWGNRLIAEMWERGVSPSDAEKRYQNTPICQLHKELFGEQADCKAEIEKDRQGFRPYTPHILNNDSNFPGDLLFARDLGVRNQELIERYPALDAYRLGEDSFERWSK